MLRPEFILTEDDMEFPKKNKSGRYNTRYERNRHIIRKKRIDKSIQNPLLYTPFYKHDGQYSKGKIHCSCSICTYSKTYKLETYKEKKDKEYVKMMMDEYIKEQEETEHEYE